MNWQHSVKQVIGNAELYLGDCAQVVPYLPNYDLLLTDPPYGIGEANGKNKSRGINALATDYGSKDWDDKVPPSWLIEMLISKSTYQIIFGGNYFGLPPTSCFLVWDKENGNNDFADAEIAWTNLKKAVRLHKYRWSGMLQGNMKNKEKRYHPTQKPLNIMEWCISQAPTNNIETIFDPFMGSGTSGIAALKFGKKFIGIEKDKEYFDIACNRIEDSLQQQSLFHAQPQEHSIYQFDLLTAEPLE